ncbi:host attachment protein [Acidihalobacter ferrooxydans]|uniref:Host attachment protein n=1 Tax=Acidihalobacter ferrooxydans TaxID=1765967 RepID=A0A1P8UEU7_9GAMM|nr:host attachment protein [Acidihalobacter ferrooxydans]APZ42377.1 hypothetical protein BW247_04120 [Acidihalobacter ferrooxydans]
MVHTIWVLAANAGRARLFSSSSRNGTLIEQETWVDGDARRKGSDINTDRAGRAHDGSGLARHSMEPRVDPKTEEAKRFARLICERLNANAQSNGGCTRLHIAASPAFLGRLREYMSASLRGKVSSETAKDLTTLDPRSLRRHLPDFL